MIFPIGVFVQSTVSVSSFILVSSKFENNRAEDWAGGTYAIGDLKSSANMRANMCAGGGKWSDGGRPPRK